MKKSCVIQNQQIQSDLNLRSLISTFNTLKEFYISPAFFRSKSKSLKILNKFNNLVNQSINWDRLPEIINKTIVEDLGHKFCILGCAESTFNSLEMNYISKELNYKLSNYPLLKNKSILTKSFFSKKSFVITNNFYKAVNLRLDSNIKFLIGFPLVINNVVVGIFCCGTNILSKHDAYILQLIAQQLSIVLENINLNRLANSNIDIDPLTELMNHNYFQKYLNQELKRTDRFAKSLSMLMIDFYNTEKNLSLSRIESNGDCIKELSNNLKKSVRDIDITARLSNTRMAVLMPETSLEEANVIAQNILENNNEFLSGNNLVSYQALSTYPNISENKETLLNDLDSVMTKLFENIKRNKKSIIADPTNISSIEPDIIDTEQASCDPLLKDYLSDGLLDHLNYSENLSYNSSILFEIITSLAAAIDAKDSYTKGHSQVVSRYAEMLCQNMGLGLPETEVIKVAALMHDIGKIGIPETVLAKPSPLSDDEWAIMRTHPTIGARRIIQPISALNDLIPIVEHHHERWDGLGYPFGLKKDEIPLGARIVAVVDAFHTMITNRPYRAALSYEEAVNVLEHGAGAQWDSSIVKSFIEIARHAYNENMRFS